MRLCRFSLDELVLTGLLRRRSRHPDRPGERSLLRGPRRRAPPAHDRGPARPPAARRMLEPCRRRAGQVGGRTRRGRARRALAADRVRPAAHPDRPPQEDLPAGRQLLEARRRGGRYGRPPRGDVPLRLPETADDHADQSRRSHRPPRDVPRPHRLGMRAGRGDRSSLPRRRRGGGARLRRRLHDRQRHQRPEVRPPRRESGRASATRSSSGCTASGTTPSARSARASSRPTRWPTRRPSRSS